jgi:hypothetical protein
MLGDRPRRAARARLTCRHWSRTPGLVSVATTFVLVAVLSGCGSGANTVVKTVTVAAKTPARARTHRARHQRAAHSRRTASGSAQSRAARAASGAGSGFSYCDANVQARAATTTCGFAQNTFYEYWTNGQASALQVYSPTTGLVYETTCAGHRDEILCTTTDGGAVRFSQASVASYDQDQADAYASNHDLGPASQGPAGTSPPPPPSTGTPSNFCDTHDCIPNYPNGNGTTVQCADGTYSHSGGIQGACSHHGGVG